jgi:hypothetical protein
MIARITVLFPAPLRPSKQPATPFCKSNETPVSTSP